MAFDERWEQTHKDRVWGLYPNEQFTYFMRRVGPDSREKRKNFQVLDVGSGGGANAWLLAREGYATTALDGSQTALFRIYNRLKAEDLGAQLVRADLHEPLQFPDDSFNAICDIHASCYGTQEQVGATIKELHRILKPGGSLFCLLPKAGCENEHFTRHGACHLSTHEDILTFFRWFYGFACQRTVCIDMHQNEQEKPFLEYWTLEAIKAE